MRVRKSDLIFSLLFVPLSFKVIPLGLAGAKVFHLTSREHICIQHPLYPNYVTYPMMCKLQTGLLVLVTRRSRSNYVF